MSADITSTNRAFYDALWTRAHLQRPERFNTWPLVSGLLPSSAARLEIGPGLRPRLPVAGTHFLDLSAPAVERLNASGGFATQSKSGRSELPFQDQQFDLVCACDVIEHVSDDRRLFSEVSRVLKDGGVFLCSVPIFAALWSDFDDWVGHARRYEPAELCAVLAENGFKVEKSTAYGMQSPNNWWVRQGQWWLKKHPDWAMFWYNWVGMPVALRFQKPMTFASGVIDTTGVDELMLVCRRVNRQSVGIA